MRIFLIHHSRMARKYTAKRQSDGIWIGNRMYWTLKQLLITLYKHLLDTGQCSQSRSSLRFLVAASYEGRSFCSGFTNCPCASAAVTIYWPGVCRFSLELLSWILGSDYTRSDW
jgi:hypothetical protein